MTQPNTPRGGWQNQPPGPPQPTPQQPWQPPGAPASGTPSWAQQPRDPRNVAPGGQSWADSLVGQPPGWVQNQQRSAPGGMTPPSAAMQGGQASQGANPWYPQDPHQPLGNQQHARVSIDSFQQPKQRTPWIVILVVAVIVGALGFGAYKASGPSTPPITSTTPTPSQSQQSSTPQVTTTMGQNSVPFTSQSDGAEGVWEITKSEWTSRGLEVTTKITVNKGSLNYTFFALDNDSTDDYDPKPGDSKDITAGYVNAGESVEGVIIFDKSKGDTTVYLANGRGRQITALMVKG